MSHEHASPADSARASTSRPARPAAAPSLRGRTLQAWRWALAFFVLAALTGVFFRFALVSGSTGGLSTVNVRHAHSHLMFFGWVAPALIAVVAARLPSVTGRPAPAGLRAVFVGLFGTALAAWVLFGLYGYESTPIGSARIPLSTIASTAAMVVWYGFAGVYVRWTRGVPRTAVLRRLDWAVGALVACTTGAWALGAMVPFGLHVSLAGEAAKHVFLDGFTHGWLLLGVLALARASTGPSRAPRSLPLLILGLPGTVALSLPPEALPGPTLTAAGALGVVFAAGVAIEAADLLPRVSARWIAPLVAVILVAGALGVAGTRPHLGLASHAGLRLLYLHVLLLGGVSLGLVAAAEDLWGRASWADSRWLTPAVGAVIASLLPFTPLWPSALAGPHWLTVAAWLAILPPLVVAVATFGAPSPSPPR